MKVIPRIQFEGGSSKVEGDYRTTDVKGNYEKLKNIIKLTIYNKYSITRLIPF